MKYKKKPVVIEARQFTDDFSGIEISHWCNCEYTEQSDGYEDFLTIHTLEGDMLGKRGDWIVKGVNEEFYPCKPDIFEKTYDLVIESSDR